MQNNNFKYIFCSSRLGFRNWNDPDVSEMVRINKDSEVMKFFPILPTKKQTVDFISRMQKQFEEKGYTYFAVDNLEKDKFIGFIGLSYQTFESEFSPFVDIGWRLDKSEWNKGLATEGAKACLQYGFETLRLDSIKAVCPKINLPSENIMKKIGMTKIKDFKHPLLTSNHELEACVLYEIKSSDFINKVS